MISVLILTKNEEQDLPGCLSSVSWSDDVHVFDSYSDDKTVHLALEAGAKVTQRKFDGYATQRNASLTHVAYKYPWVFILDADERVPLPLVSLMEKHIKEAEPDVNAFRIRRRDYLNKTWLKHAQISPFYIRLVRIGKAYYHREINEVIQVEGKVADIDGYFDHYPFSKGYDFWLNKHNKYSAMEAQRWVLERSAAIEFSFKKALLCRDFNERRYHQKGLFYKMPARPIIKWLYMVFWRRAFLDGSAGITYSTLQAVYEYFIVLKAKEHLRSKKSRMV